MNHIIFMETTLEHILLNSYKADMIRYLKNHQEDYEEAIKLAISEKQPYSQRAAWLLWSCMDENDQRIKPHIEEIIDSLTTKSDNHKRELFIILQKLDIDEDYEGRLFDICVDVWCEINKKPSVRYNAFKLIVKIAKKHPDLSNEVSFLTQKQYMEHLSDTVKKSILKMMTELI